MLSCVPRFISQGSTFVRSLGMGSLQFCGYVQSAKLPPLSPNIVIPASPLRGADNAADQSERALLSLAAGAKPSTVVY